MYVEASYVMSPSCIYHCLTSITDVIFMLGCCKTLIHSFCYVDVLHMIPIYNTKFFLGGGNNYSTFRIKIDSVG